MTCDLHVALVGAPNCGKTALFNTLTGSRQKVANYAGVTVERKEGMIRPEWGVNACVLDLPGTYSLRARSPDERITRDVVRGRLPGEPPPDVIVCEADATNLRLGLRLALELKRVGRPMVLAVNMADIAQRMGIEIDLSKLASLLGMPVVSTVATRNRGMDALVFEIADAHKRCAPACGADWAPLTADGLRALQAEAERMFTKAVILPKLPATQTRRIDSVLLHPVGGIMILLAVLFVMFQAVFTWAAPFMGAIEATFGWLGGLVVTHVPDGLLRSFITDALISGVGGVVVFLPQILILFLFIILLEDSGYMARAAFLMDKLMGGAGLHGRAFIPLLSSFACAIPSIMATRVIDHRRDRLTTILVAPLMTCSARIPVYTLIISAFIPNQRVGGFNLQGLVMFGLYAAGIVGALAVAWIIRKLFWRGAVEPFMMELPSYKRPTLKAVWIGLRQRAEIFLRRAGGIIFLMTVIIWALSTFPLGSTVETSLAGQMGRAIHPLLQPIGFNWQMAIALIPAMGAREIAVAALATVYAVADGGEGLMLGQKLAAHWSLSQALSFLTWFIFAPQCLSTLAVIKREAGGWRWAWLTFGYMIALAYGASWGVYRLASLWLGA